MSIEMNNQNYKNNFLTKKWDISVDFRPLINCYLFISKEITKRSVGKMSFVSLEDDSSVDSESECFWNDTSISHHRQNEKCQENGSLTKKQDIPSIEDVREDSPLSKLLSIVFSTKTFLYSSRLKRFVTDVSKFWSWLEMILKIDRSLL